MTTLSKTEVLSTMDASLDKGLSFTANSLQNLATDRTVANTSNVPLMKTDMTAANYGKLRDPRSPRPAFGLQSRRREETRRGSSVSTAQASLARRRP